MREKSSFQIFCIYHSIDVKLKSPTEGVGEVRGELPDDEGDGQRADREDLGAAEGAARRLHGRPQGGQGQDLQPQEGEKCQLLASALAPLKSIPLPTLPWFYPL